MRDFARTNLPIKKRAEDDDNQKDEVLPPTTELLSHQNNLTPTLLPETDFPSSHYLPSIIQSALQEETAPLEDLN